MLKSATDRIARGELPKDSLLLRFDASGARRSIVAWRVTGRPESGPAIVGIVADSDVTADVFARIIKQSPLLPPSLAAGDSANLLAVRVSSPDGHELFASSTAWSPYTSRTALD